MGRTIAAAGCLLLLVSCGAPAKQEAAGSDRISSSAADSALAGAASDPDTPVSSDDPVPTPPSGATFECPVVQSGGWSAVVLGKPPSLPDRLRVSGTIRLSGSGVTARLEQGPVLEIHPPIQRVELVFERSAAGPGSDPREVAVSGEFPALSEYGAIEIRCGGRSLATIADIVWTE